jgi:hypothetical protein
MIQWIKLIYKIKLINNFNKKMQIMIWIKQCQIYKILEFKRMDYSLNK